jgi:hypothetical protein
VVRWLTRRELMAGAVGGAIAGRLAPGAARAEAPAPSDAELLGKALEVERLMVLAYRRVLASNALSPALQRAIAPHLGHELAHMHAVAARLRALGAPAPTGALDSKRAADLMGQHDVSDSLTDLRTQNECLKLLVDLESVGEGVYYTALKDLRSPALQRLSAQIMACEAQHWTVLSGLRNPGQYVKAVPWPYVYGTK